MQAHGNFSMKITTFSPVPVEQESGQNSEQSEFVRRGLASIARSEAAGDWIPAEDVIAKLEAKLAAARERGFRRTS